MRFDKYNLEPMLLSLEESLRRDIISYSQLERRESKSLTLSRIYF